MVVRKAGCVALFLVFNVFNLFSQMSSAQLSQNFYVTICPNVEDIVRGVVQTKMQQAPATVPGTLRLFFHDCFIQGCDASVIIASSGNNTAEKDHQDNLSLVGDGFDTVMKAKTAVDAVPSCRNKVSCADILAMAARDVIVAAGGPSYTVELGRFDGLSSTSSSVTGKFPKATFNLDQLNAIFASNAFSQTEMIALSGKKAIMKAKPIVINAVTDLYKKSFPKLLTFADLGCSSGPNSLLIVSEVIDALYTTCQKEGYAAPGLQIFLNDLPTNDYNTLFKFMSDFHHKVRQDWGDEFGACFIAGVPGSFYGRLFPDKSLHFVHSSYSLQFLTQVPPGIENNRGNVYIGVTSPTNVPKAYCTQFRKDFTMFLKMRSEEILPGGRMVITMLGRKNSNPCSKECSYYWDLLAQSLCDLISLGFVEETKLDSFNVPCYYPSREEIRTMLHENGSFQLDCLELFDLSMDVKEEQRSRHFAATMRAVFEPMITSHFGQEIIEQLFAKYTENAAKYLEQEEEFKFATLLMCMTKFY